MNIDVKILKNKFKDFVSNYDMKEPAIIKKFYHSYRVMDFCISLAKDNDFDIENTEMVILAGLLHDYARFEQWTKFRIFNDRKSIDHGDLAVKKLFGDNEIINYCTNKNYYNDIYNAIKYHNKYSYPNNLSNNSKLLCNVVRDADKLDIFYLISINEILVREDDEMISDSIKNNFYSNKLIRASDVQSKNDNVMLKLSMVFDLNFDYSFKYIYENKLIDKIYDNINNKDLFNPYFKYLNNYIEKKINNINKKRVKKV